MKHETYVKQMQEIRFQMLDFPLKLSNLRTISQIIFTLTIRFFSCLTQKKTGQIARSQLLLYVLIIF